MKQINEIS